METDGLFVLHFTGTGRGCFFNQEKIDASAVRQDFFAEHPYRIQVGQDFSQNMIETWICCTLDCAFGPSKVEQNNWLNDTFSVDQWMSQIYGV